MDRIICIGVILLICILVSYSILYEKFTNYPNDVWRHPPSNEKLVKNKFVPLGHSLPLTDIYTTQGSTGPSIDGTDKSPNNMFMFAYNQCKPECCPSTYSCDGGCICTTKKQRKYIVSRGNNKSIPQNNEY